jgi:hypothetical protein
VFLETNSDVDQHLSVDVTPAFRLCLLDHCFPPMPAPDLRPAGNINSMDRIWSQQRAQSIVIEIRSILSARHAKASQVWHAFQWHALKRGRKVAGVPVYHMQGICNMQFLSCMQTNVACRAVSAKKICIDRPLLKFPCVSLSHFLGTRQRGAPQ